MGEFYPFRIYFLGASVLNPVSAALTSETATGRSTRNIRGKSMAKYCVTAANHNNAKDQRASEFEVWQWNEGVDGKNGTWKGLGRKSLNYVAGLLAQGNQVLSAKENPETITTGYPIELELRIAKNDKNFKITDLPPF